MAGLHMTAPADVPTSGKRVLILLMPMATPEFPGLGPTLIRSILVSQGEPCDIVYGNLVFSRVIGGDAFVEHQLSKVAAAEILFTPYYFDTPREDAAEYLRDYVSHLVENPRTLTTERFTRLVDAAGRCLDELYSGIRWEDYDVVGFSVMMQQTVASLALARRIKAEHPHIRIVFGGPSTSLPMGDEMIRSFPEIDVVVEGEADAAITPLVRELRARPQGPFTVPGVLYRAPDGSIRHTGPAVPFHDLDSLPAPDYEPFFTQLEALGIRHVQPYIQIETSRGCWWGEKHHCTFCGIDDTVLKYRSKSDGVVIREILTLAARHQYPDFFSVDSIINHRSYKTLLPALGQLRDEEESDISFFFESKSNIKREQVQAYRHGGVNAVQPGVESFDDHILSLMNKGTTAARQIQCVKLLSEFGLVPNWNLIYRLPGETAEDYRRTVEIIPLLHHLPPLHGEGLIPMLLNRFAPYHNTPEQFGITNIRPLDWYRHVYPRPGIDLDRLAFYFEYDHPNHQDAELDARHAELEQAIWTWRACWRPDALLQTRGPGFVQVHDRRAFPGPGGVPEERDVLTTLVDVWAEIFTACDEVTTEAELLRAFSDRVPGDDLLGFLAQLAADRLVYRSPGGQVVNLPLLLEARERQGTLPAPAAALARAG
jgi:ribosomal peptide maturation radical SAM protein 1